MIQNKASIITKNENGAVLILVVIGIVMLIGMTALAFDVSHLVVAKNELQNAADAGALRGARMLYSDDGTYINTGANQEAYDAAVSNCATECTPPESFCGDWCGTFIVNQLGGGKWQYTCCCQDFA